MRRSSPERPVVEDLLLEHVLDANLLAAHVSEVVHPVEGERIDVGRACAVVCALFGLRANALLDAQGISGEVVDDPQVLVMGNDARGDVSHARR